MADPSDQEFIERVCFIAQHCKMIGYDDVAAWMQKHLAQRIVEARGKRRRGVKATLARINRDVVLDAARVAELAQDQNNDEFPVRL